MKTDKLAEGDYWMIEDAAQENGLDLTGEAIEKCHEYAMTGVKQGTYGYAMKMEEYLSLEQLKIVVKAEYSQDLTHGAWHRFDNGWLSTSTKTPMQGGIFLPVKDGAFVSFTTKWGDRVTGIVTCFDYEKSMDKVFLSVLTPEEISPGFYHRYMVSRRQLTILSGTIEMPATPKF